MKKDLKYFSLFLAGIALAIAFSFVVGKPAQALYIAAFSPEDLNDMGLFVRIIFNLLTFPLLWNVLKKTRISQEKYREEMWLFCVGFLAALAFILSATPGALHAIHLFHILVIISVGLAVPAAFHRKPKQEPILSSVKAE